MQGRCIDRDRRARRHFDSGLHRQLVVLAKNDGRFIGTGDLDEDAQDSLEQRLGYSLGRNRLRGFDESEGINRHAPVDMARFDREAFGAFELDRARLGYGAPLEVAIPCLPEVSDCELWFMDANEKSRAQRVRERLVLDECILRGAINCFAIQFGGFPRSIVPAGDFGP